MTTTPHVRLFDRTTPPHIMTLILLAGIGALNMSIFLPSLNRMTAYFDTSYAIMQIALSGYLALTAVLQIFVGPISDKVGRRNVVLVALIIFVIASLGAALSTSVEVFLFFRLLQAAVATTLVLSRTIVRDMVSQDQAASMIGYVTMGMALVPMVGPFIGGALETTFGWQASFAFLTIAGLAVLALSYFDLGETVQEGGMGFREQFSQYPALFASPRFWGYTLAMAFASGAFFAFLGGAPFMAETVFGLSPLWSGVALGAPAIGYAYGNFLSGRHSVRLGINRMALTGTFITLFGLGLSLILTLSGVNNALVFFGLVTFMGVGNGLTMPNATSGLLSVRPRLAGTASGLGGAIMVGGGAGLAQYSGSLLSVEAGTLPLQLIMVTVSVLAMLSLLFVIWRGKHIGA